MTALNDGTHITIKLHSTYTGSPSLLCCSQTIGANFNACNPASTLACTRHSRSHLTHWPHSQVFFFFQITLDYNQHFLILFSENLHQCCKGGHLQRLQTDKLVRAQKVFAEKP